MVHLDVLGELVEQPARNYMEETGLMYSLEAGIEDVLRTCVEAAGTGKKQDPINHLARWLMRNNPRFDSRAAELVRLLRVKALQRQEEDAAAEVVRLAYEAEVAEEQRWKQIHRADAATRHEQKKLLLEHRKLPPRVKLRHPVGEMVMELPYTAALPPMLLNRPAKRTIISLYGPVGAAKTAVGKHLEMQLDLPVLECSDRQTRGGDREVQAALAERAAWPDCKKGCIFVDYPHDESQAAVFEQWLRVRLPIPSRVPSTCTIPR
jgi:hypothetical protein